jgi:putative peptidoglycan lipid II flippase
LVTIIVVGPVMLAAYLLLLRLFRVTELADLLRPLLGRLGRRSGPAPSAAANAGASAGAAGSAGAASGGRTTPERATVSSDTGLIPRISGEFDSASFRAGGGNPASGPPDLPGNPRSEPPFPVPAEEEKVVLTGAGQRRLPRPLHWIG